MDRWLTVSSSNALSPSATSPLPSRCSSTASRQSTILVSLTLTSTRRRRKRKKRDLKHNSYHSYSYHSFQKQNFELYGWKACFRQEILGGQVSNLPNREKRYNKKCFFDETAFLLLGRLETCPPSDNFCLWMATVLLEFICRMSLRPLRLSIDR